MGKFDVITLETYDPKALGARCDECILKNAKGGPIPPEYHDKATAAIITDYPREKELATSRPLSGSHGMFLNDTLQSVGTRRTKVDLHHAIACMPPEADLDKVMLKWTRENKRRTKQGFDPVPSPLECCRPRLLNELDHQNLVTLGKTAYQSITGKNRPIHDIRGGPVDGGFDATGNFLIASDPSLYAQPLKVLPTLHPGFVQQSKRWSRAFKSDLSRAFRWFSGHLGWKEPRITLNPTPAQLDLFLRRQDVPFIFDVETTFDDPLVAKLKCVGISDEDHAVVVHFLSIEGPGGTLVGGPYTEIDELEIRGILRDFFADSTRLKVGHNAGYFDRLVIKQHFDVDPQPLLDTILLHRSVESELPHKLGYVGSIYTDVTAWKEAHTASEARNDYELGVYCAVDCCVTARAMPKLYEAALHRGQDQVVQFDHKIQEVCVGLHEAGMFVDLEQRAKESARLTEEMKVFGEAARMASGNRDMNLNSTPQLRDLLYNQWLLAPVAYTKLGDPSTNDESLRLLRTANKTEERVCNFIDSLRRYRRASKEYGTYVKRLVPYNSFNDSSEQLDEDEDGEQSDVAQEMIAGKKKKRGMILGDGRVHPDYNAHGTTSGRLSSSNPNAQNWPKHLRGMIIPQPGHVLVGADADQLELRSIASVAGIARYLDIFEKGGDPHAETAAMMFGKSFTSLVPKSDQWDKLRKIAKSIKYASFYGSGDETVHNLVTSAEDEKGNLMYPDLSLREVATLRRNWLKGIPELPKWWDDVLEEYRGNGFVADPVLGRRRDFLDGEEFNEIINFPIQSGSAHVIHMATFDLLQVMPFSKWGPGTGLIAQVHDALYAEVPCPHEQFSVPNGPNGKPDEKLREFGWCPPGCRCEANWAARQIEEAMNRTHPGFPDVTFSATAKIAKRWSKV